MSGRLLTAVCFLVAGLSASGCERQETAADAVAGQNERRPVGAAAYRSLLSERSGVDLEPAELATLAATAERRIEERMNRLVAGDGARATWREVFPATQKEHPRTVDETLETYRAEIERSAAFVAAHELVTLPPSPPEVLVAENPIVTSSFPLALYLNGRLAVTLSPPGPELDPSYLANHCYACIPPLAVHEAYPGHHVAFYHAAIAAAGKTLGEQVEIKGRPANLFFHEGWALYGELLLLERGYYPTLEEELSAWRMLLLRAIRARLDAELHGEIISPDEVVATYQERLLMDEAAARAELNGHLMNPGNKASYFIGLSQLLTLRRQLQERGPELDLRGFHNAVLSLPGNIPRLARQKFGIELGALGPLELGDS